MEILLEGQFSGSTVSLPERNSAAGQEPSESRDCFPVPPQHKHRGSGVPAAGLLQFLKQGFLFAFVSPWSKGRGCEQKAQAALGQRGKRLLLFGISAEMHLRPALAAKLKMNP